MQTMKQVVLILVSPLRHLSICTPGSVSSLMQNSAQHWFSGLASAYSLSFEGRVKGECTLSVHLLIFVSAYTSVSP